MSAAANEQDNLSDMDEPMASQSQVGGPSIIAVHIFCIFIYGKIDPLHPVLGQRNGNISIILFGKY